MSWIAVAIGGGALLGAAGSVVAGNSASKAQQGANATNQAIADQANTYNLQMYNLSRGIGENGQPVNATLPLSFTTGSGQPLEQALLAQILGIGGLGNLNEVAAGGLGATKQVPQVTPDTVKEYLDANPQIRDSTAEWLAQDPNEKRSVYQWVYDDMREDPTSVHTKQFADYFAPAVASTETVTPTVTPATVTGDYGAVQAAADARNKLINDLLTGSTGQDRLAQLQAIVTARAGQGDALSAQILQAIENAKGVNTAETGGAQSLADAYAALAKGRLGQVDTIGRAYQNQADVIKQASLDATQQALSRQAAIDAMRGFKGTSSTDALLRARILASGATTAAQAGAAGQLATEQLRLQNLDDSGVTSAQLMGQAAVDAANRLAQFNTKDVGVFNAASALQNAQERQQLSDQNLQLQLGALDAPIQAILQDVQASQAKASLPYSSLDAILARLKQFQTGQTSPATAVAPTASAVPNTGMIAGSALSNMGTGLFNYGLYNSLINKTPATTPYTTTPATEPGYVGSTIQTMCWVAREVYGPDNPKWLMFRRWVLNKAPAWFRNLYRRRGSGFAQWLHFHPSLKPVIRLWMDSRIRV